jgi:hypothetical protein
MTTPTPPDQPEYNGRPDAELAAIKTRLLALYVENGSPSLEQRQRILAGLTGEEMARLREIGCR